MIWTIDKDAIGDCLTELNDKYKLLVACGNEVEAHSLLDMFALVAEGVSGKAHAFFRLFVYRADNRFIVIPERDVMYHGVLMDVDSHPHFRVNFCGVRCLDCKVLEDNTEQVEVICFGDDVLQQHCEYIVDGGTQTGIGFEEHLLAISYRMRGGKFVCDTNVIRVETPDSIPSFCNCAGASFDDREWFEDYDGCLPTHSAIRKL